MCDKTFKQSWALCEHKYKAHKDKCQSDFSIGSLTSQVSLAPVASFTSPKLACASTRLRRAAPESTGCVAVTLQTHATC